MNIQKMVQFISFKKAFFIALLVFSFSIIFVDSAKAADWKKTPAQCPSVYEGYGQTGGPGEGMCGVLGNTALWFSTSSLVLLVPTVSTNTNNTPGVNLGGYVVDCHAYDASPLPDGPFCDNNTNFWCSPDPSCNSLYVKTTCNASKWAIDSGAFTCVTPGAAPSTTGCISGYANCNIGTSDPNNCEVRIGVTTCTGAGGLQGTFNASCDCIVPASNFRTGIQAEFLTSSPLLWGKQYGDGDLIRFTNNKVSTSSFVVFNSGQVAIGHNINVSTTSVAFEVSSTQRGILIPRLGGTNPITNGVDGELYYNTTSKKFMYYNGLAWGELGSGGSSWVTTTLLSVSGNATGLYPAGTVSTTIGIGSTGTDIWLQTSSTPRLYVAENGNVGIGTTSPQEKLSVVGNISNLITNQSGVGRISFVNLTVGSVGDYGIYSIDVSGRYAYVGGPGLGSTAANFSIIDINDIYNPEPIFTTSGFATYLRDIKVAGKYAYLGRGTSSGNFKILDISNPKNPVEISSSTFGTSLRTLEIVGNYAYVGNNASSNNFRIIDISNPRSPINISTITIGSTVINSIQIVGNYAYITNIQGANNFSVVDISDPYNPINISTITAGLYSIYSVQVSGRYAYIGNGTGAADNFRIIDISDPYNPVVTSTLKVGSASITSIKISGRYAYIGSFATTDNFHIVDISNPSSPINIFSDSIAGSNVRAVNVSGRYAFVGTMTQTNGTFNIIDISGTEVSSLIAHSSEIGNLQVRNNIITQGIGQFGSLNVGAGGLLVNGSLSVSATNSPSYFGGNVGIGTTSPIFKLTLGEDGGIYSAWPDYTPLGSLEGAVLPSTSSGTLMFWYPRKAAFRAGVMDRSQPNSDAWDESNIGLLSFSFGGNNVASATGTFVVGGANTSSGQYSSITGGTFNNITGNVSFIGGGFTNTISSGNSAIGGGSYNTISGAYSFIGAGRDNVASGYASFVGGGRNNTSSGQYSVSFGYDNEVSGNYSFVSGQMNEVSGYNSVAFGNKMNVSGAYSFGINLEPDDEGGVVNLSNDRVLAVMGGNVGIGTSNPLAKLSLDNDGSILAQGTSGSGWNGGTLGAGSRMMWIASKGAFRAGKTWGTNWDTTKIGFNSIALGEDHLVTSSFGFAAGGRSHEITGDSSVVIGGENNIISDSNSGIIAGWNNIISDRYSVISGGQDNLISNEFSFIGGGTNNTVSGAGSVIFGGYNNTVSGNYSSAFGYNMNVSGGYSFGINVSTTAATLSRDNTIALMGGNVGIGTTSPQSLLDVSGDSATIRISDHSSTRIPALIFMRGTSTVFGEDIWTDWKIENNSGELRFSANANGVSTTSLYLGSSGKIGMNTIPLTSLHLAGDGAILATGTYGSGWDGGSLGAGTRLMWIPSKGAFRVGYVNGTEWDETNIGAYSAVFGYNSLASGSRSFIGGGYNSSVTGNYSSVIGGFNNKVAGANSFIGAGSSNFVSSTYSTAFGYQSGVSANADYSFAGGYNSLVSSTASWSGDYSFAYGYQSKTGGNGSFAMGYQAEAGIKTNSPTALYNNSVAIGNIVKAQGFNTFALGQGYTNTTSNSMGVAFNTSGSTEEPALHIKGYGETNTRIGIGGVNNAGTGWRLYVHSGGTSSPSIMTDGKIFIGGDISSLSLVGSGNREVGADTLGRLIIYPSDINLKNNLVTISSEIDVIEGLKKLRGVYYNWDTSNSSTENLGEQREIGMVAQEIENIIPEIIGTMAGGYKTINYSHFTAFLLEVAKVQQTEIEALREAVSTTLSVQQSGGQLTYSGGDLDLQNYALLNVKNIVGTDNKWAIDENGQFITRIQTSGGNTKEMFAMQSPYSEFVFSSSSELVNGEAIINFDPDTCELIDETQPLKVNITLTGECSGIFVKEKSATGFIVKELGGGNSSSTFDWMVIAKRKFATTSPQSSPLQGEEGVPSPLEGEGEDEVEIPPTLEGEGEAEPLTETGDGGEVVTTTPEIPPEPPIEESTTTPEVLPEPPIEEPPVEAEPLTEQSSGDGEPTP